jgi:hypothetical protein
MEDQSNILVALLRAVDGIFVPGPSIFRTRNQGLMSPSAAMVFKHPIKA